MKLLFRPPLLALLAIGIAITLCCSPLLGWDSAGNLVVHSYSVWGDWSAHFTFISNLLERGPAYLWGDNPVFSGIPFQYPFLSHVLTAILAWILRFFSMTTAQATIAATFWSSLALMFALPFCLYYWCRSLKLKPWTCIVAILLFLLIGGFQFFDSSLSVTEPLTNQFSKGSIFTQFVAFELFPQRAFLFGLVAFSLLGGKLLRDLNAGRFGTKKAIVLGAAFAFTAWLHLHTWIAFGDFLLCYWIFSAKPEQRKRVLVFGVGVAAFSALLLGFLLMRNHANDTRLSWTWWQPGWAQNEKAGIAAAAAMNPIAFWLYNTGIFLPLALIGLFLKRKERSLRALGAAGLILVVVALLFNIQPYFYDNLKLFTYGFWFLAPFAASALEPLFSRKSLFAAGAVLLVLQCWSGASDLEFLRSGHQNTLFFRADEFRLAEHFKAIRKSADDLVLIAPRHNHWVPCLAGNPVVMGYPGWLWSWGISYGDREHEVQDILLGKDTMTETAKRLGVDYIVVQRGETVANQPVNFSALESHFQNVLSENGWEIFSTKSPSSSVR